MKNLTTWLKNHKILSGLLVFAFIGLISSIANTDLPMVSEDVSEPLVVQEELVINEVTKQEYSVLKEWNPNDSNKLGFEILYTPLELSENSVEALVREIYIENDNRVQIIKIFLTEEAWTSEDYGPEFVQGYLAYVLIRDDEAEIRWFQEEGKLAHLSGQETVIELDS